MLLRIRLCGRAPQFIPFSPIHFVITDIRKVVHGLCAELKLRELPALYEVVIGSDQLILPDKLYIQRGYCRINDGIQRTNAYFLSSPMRCIYVRETGLPFPVLKYFYAGGLDRF